MIGRLMFSMKYLCHACLLPEFMAPGTNIKLMTRIFLFALILCAIAVDESLAQKSRPIDKNATAETKALFRNLKKAFEEAHAIRPPARD